MENEEKSNREYIPEVNTPGTGFQLAVHASSKMNGAKVNPTKLSNNFTHARPPTECPEIKSTLRKVANTTDTTTNSKDSSSKIAFIIKSIKHILNMLLKAPEKTARAPEIYLAGYNDLKYSGELDWATTSRNPIK
uniref:Uncharacterized protein n=1 Tax=Glossina austeni TaxID=7395 RepID=A0A1A9VVM1_GLOAU